MNKIQMKHIESAIIGYWRMGVVVDIMAILTGLSKNQVESIINEYSINKLKGLTK